MRPGLHIFSAVITHHVPRDSFFIHATPSRHTAGDPKCEIDKMGRNEDRDIIPGTEIVFESDSATDRSGELILIPHPTANLDDPLNWSPLWKSIVIFNQFVFVFVSIMTPLAIAPMTEIFIMEFQKTLPQVNLLFGVAAITLGYANFVIVPAANVFGRRPVVMICGLICVLANVWQALVTSFPSFLGARVISGLGAAANESIMPMVVADVLFLHQRGRSMALYLYVFDLCWRNNEAHSSLTRKQLGLLHRPVHRTHYLRDYRSPDQLALVCKYKRLIRVSGFVPLQD